MYRLSFTCAIPAAILSWTHHLSSVEGGMDEIFWYYPAICPPAEFLTRGFPWRLAWCVKHHLRHFIDWLQAWCDTLDRADIQAHVTTYEQFVRDRASFFAGILTHAGISSSNFVDPHPLPGKEHLFRTGRVDEWRDVMSPEMASHITNAIARNLLERFGWNA